MSKAGPMRSIGLALLASACVRAPTYGNAPGPADQAKAALAGDAVNQDPKSKFRIGQIDPAMKPVRGKALASSPFTTTTLLYRGLRDGKVCFSFDYGAQYYRSHGTQKDAENERAAGAKLNVFSFELHEDLDDLDGTWPAAPATQLVSARVIDSKLEDRVRENANATMHTEWLETTIEVCGNAPKAVEAPRYLTATRYPSDAGRAPTFFIWAIQPQKR